MVSSFRSHRPRRFACRGWLLALTILGATACGPAAAPPPAAHGAGEKDFPRGAHGGRLLADGAFQLEITIYERGVPPEFRLYPSADGQALPPGEVQAAITLRRLGGRVDAIAFRPQEDYLVGDRVVEEPHSFDVEVAATWRGDHRWQYSQVEGRVQLSDEAVRTSAISIETAGPRSLKTLRQLPAEVSLDADRLAQIVPQTGGTLRRFVKNQGDSVARGELLAAIDSRELAEAKRGFIDSGHELALARRTFEREKGLFEQRITSEAGYLQAEREQQEAELRHRSARQQLEALGVGQAALERLLAEPDGDLTLYELRAPFAGVLIEKEAVTGQAVAAGQKLGALADLSSVWVEATVYPQDLKVVRAGQQVEVRSPDLGIAAPGRIAYVTELVGGEARTARARIVLPDPERQWRPGLFVSVDLVSDESPAAVAVRREALQKFRDWDVVFVRVGDLFEARPLELGRIDGDWVEVLSGLAPGERYAAANSFVLKADVGKSGASHDH